MPHYIMCSGSRINPDLDEHGWLGHCPVPLLAGILSLMDLLASLLEETLSNFNVELSKEGYKKWKIY